MHTGECQRFWVGKSLCREEKACSGSEELEELTQHVLTVEAAARHRELLQVRERRPSRRDAARELVRRAGELTIAAIKNELFERRGHHGQRPYDRTIDGISDLVADVVGPPHL